MGGHEFTSLKLFYFVFGFLGAEAGGAFAFFKQKKIFKKKYKKYKNWLQQQHSTARFGSVKVEMDIPDYQSLISSTVSVDVKQHQKKKLMGYSSGDV